MRARRTDGNHAEVIAAFRSMGCAVFDCSRLGGGFPDLLVSLGGPTGVSASVEVKDGSKPPSARKLTADEKEFHKWHPVEIVEHMGDVERVVSKLRRRRGMLALERMAD